ncbi:MAG: M20 family metallo-hydrolase [Rhodobiaceae bacterium]|nr:M20 family metallo-hydrolase [Rhodobiaceae bacterium]MCC0040806.1 M20 family metallo-hydrolase [Rhodobiaceae bacterium]
MHAAAAQSAVDAKRLWDDLMTLAGFGARDDGGVCRHALSVEDMAARAWLTDKARERGYRIAADDAANLFITRPGRDDTLPPVLAGSHMDSQPAGGKFDGAYGVLAAFEALRALDNAGIETARPVACVAWTNEEGGRFHVPCTGSRAFATGAVPEPEQTDENGVPLAEALKTTLDAAPDVERIAPGFPIHAYIEPHIEQGPVLEREGLPVGVVTGIQGVRWFNVTVSGEPGHAGTVPHAVRRDAFQAALRAIGALNELMHDPDDIVRFTVGHVSVVPNSPNTIPASVTFSIDFRHPDAAVLDARASRIAGLVAEAVKPCTAVLTPTTVMQPVAFPDAVTQAIAAAADTAGLAHKQLASGAFHDAAHIAGVCPSGMIFIPCRGGLSHHPDEWATAEHCSAGARVLAGTLATLAG